MYTFSGDDESKEFSAGHSNEGFSGVHLQLMTPHEIKHRLQVLDVILFVAAFYIQIINVAFDCLPEMFLENLSHRSLIRGACIL